MISPNAWRGANITGQLVFPRFSRRADPGEGAIRELKIGNPVDPAFLPVGKSEPIL